MFTGIVDETLIVIGVAQGPMFRRLTIAHHWPDVKLGESIAVNGVCLTITELAPFEAGFDVIKETLDKTNLGLLTHGDHVNVERALRAGDRIDGHFVQGHVDGVAPLVKQIASETEWRLTIEAPPPNAKYLAPKGSIGIDGGSLTISPLNGNQVDVSPSPTPLSATTLGNAE